MAFQEPKMRMMKLDDLNAVATIDALVSKQERRQYYERKIDPNNQGKVVRLFW